MMVVKVCRGGGQKSFERGQWWEWREEVKGVEREGVGLI